MKHGLITLARLKNAGWIAAFLALCVIWGYEAMNASKRPQFQDDTAPWICPILGKCGPVGTPGLGRW
jgi:hypothetical protein